MFKSSRPPVRSGLALLLVLFLTADTDAQRAGKRAAPGNSGGIIAGEIAPPEPPPEPPPSPPRSLKHAPLAPITERITGQNLTPNYILDEKAAIALGKALFWDMQAGSDGQACASCHFHAGADNRFNNQLSPGLNGGNGTFDPVLSTGNAGPNIRLNKDDWPFHLLADPNDRDSEVLFDTDDVASSQGVFPTTFNGIIPGSAEEDCDVLGAGEGGDPIGFQVGGTNVRRVEPRNTPTTINSAFNHRNFWDGRANNIFNGVDPFGRRSEDAYVLERQPDGSVEQIKVEFENASLASQAVGPLLSDFEMSCGGRQFVDAGRKLLLLEPLALQEVATDDSVLGGLSKYPATGIWGSYEDMIKDAFDSRFWNSDKIFDRFQNEIASDNGGGGELPEDGFTLMEMNFSLFWGLAIQAYEQTLRADDTPYDQWRDGEIETIGESAERGLDLFMDQGKCINCHGTSMFTKASTLHLLDESAEEGLVERMLTYEQEGHYTVRGSGALSTQQARFWFQIDADGTPSGLGAEGPGYGEIELLVTKNRPESSTNAGGLVGETEVNKDPARYQVVGFTLGADGNPNTKDASMAAVLKEGAPGYAGAIVVSVIEKDGPDIVALSTGGSILAAGYMYGGDDVRIEQPALYDNGFYNIAVRPTHEDLGVGGEDPWGNPLSFSRQYLQMLLGEDVKDPFEVDPCSFEIPWDTEIDSVFYPGGFDGEGCSAEPSNVEANIAAIMDTHTAVDGAFKTSTIRNVALTGPYFHNGGQRTLLEVVQFYNRGGDFAHENRNELDPDIRPLGLSEQDMLDLVAFMESLTDDRVANESAPFDHPQLFIPNGHPGDHLFVVDSNGDYQADATFLEDPSVFKELPATGAGGLTDIGEDPIKPFLED